MAPTATVTAPSAQDLLPPFEPALAHRREWETLAATIAGRPFSRADGLAWSLGTPYVLSPALERTCRELVARMHRFYLAAIAAYYRDPSEPRFFVNDLFREAILASERVPRPLPLSRLDCVLTPSGELKVIEINPIGVSVHGIRMAAYVARRLVKMAPFHDYGVALGRPARQMAQSVRRASSRERPTVGFLTFGEMLRTARVIDRELFGELGLGHVGGRPDQLERGETVSLRGRPIDVLWADMLFYNAYQEARYRQTRWTTRVAGDFGSTPELVAPLLADREFVAKLLDGRLPLVSPLPSYLAISKSLLGQGFMGRIASDEEERAYLGRHVATTWALDDRQRGALTLAQAIEARGELVLKPCMYGGAHGVLAGRDTDPALWQERLRATWDDPEWVLQQFHPPATDASGAYLSIGIYNFAGEFGGMVCRASPKLVVSVRNAAMIPVAPG